MLCVPGMALMAQCALSLQQASQVGTILWAWTKGFGRLKDLSEMSQLVVASWDSEQGLILMCALLEWEGEEITATALAQPRDKEGLNQGKESKNLHSQPSWESRELQFQ